MDLCFFCSQKLNGKCTQISSSITPHGNVPFLEKISEIMGEAYTIIVKSTDHICMNCTSYLIRMDKLENEVKFIKNNIFSQILIKMGRSPPDQAIESVEVVMNAEMLNENLMADKQQNPNQLNLPSSLPLRKIPTIPFPQVKNSIDILKIPLQQKQKQQQVQNLQQVQKRQYYDGMKMKECRTQLQKPTHLNQKELVNPFVTQTAVAKILTPVPQKKKIKYRCLVCSSLFDSQLLYSKHACEKHMMKLTTLTSNRERAKKYSCPDTANISNFHISTFKKNKKLKSSMYIDDNQQDNKKGTVDAGMILKYNRQSSEQVEEIGNSSEANTAAANIVSPVPEMKIYHIKGIFCSMCYKSELSYVNELGEDNKRLTKSISNTEREIKNSCPDTANISNFHITSPKENQEAESPMHIEVDQQDNKKVQKSADYEPEKQTDNSSEANTVKESKYINSHDLTKAEEEEQQQGANRMKIFECSTHVQLQKPTHLNHKELRNHIVTQTVVAKILPPKKKSYFNCQICSKMYDIRALDLEQLYKETEMLSTFISNRESEINMSCPHTSNLPIFHLTSPQQSQEMESLMDIGDNQQDNNKDMMFSYNVPADSEQVEEIYTFSEANTAATNILSPVPEIMKPVIKGLVCSKCYDG